MLAWCATEGEEVAQSLRWCSRKAVPPSAAAAPTNTMPSPPSPPPGAAAAAAAAAAAVKMIAVRIVLIAALGTAVQAV